MSKSILFICFAVLFLGCASEVISIPKENFRSSDGSETIKALAEQTVIELYKFIELDIRNVDLHYFLTWEDQIATCDGKAGCTKIEVIKTAPLELSRGFSVNVYWPETGWEKGHPYMLAHELCHVYYFELGEGGDPNHTHQECFGRPYVEGSDPAAAYGGGEGYAWQAAVEIYYQFGR